MQSQNSCALCVNGQGNKSLQGKGSDGYSERRRRLLKSQFVSAESSRRKREKGASTTYKSGCFGTELLPVALSELSSQDVANDEDSDIVCEECKLRNCPVGRKRKKDDWLACEFYDMVSRKMCRHFNQRSTC